MENYVTLKYDNERFCYDKAQRFEVVLKEFNHVIVKMPLFENTINSRGFFHGGALAAVADEAAGIAAHTDGRYYLTSNLSINFIRNTSESDCFCDAKVVSRGKTLCISEFTIKDDKGTLLCNGHATYFCYIQDKEEDRDLSREE